MVHTTVRPVLTVFRTVRITMAAARASSPAGSNSVHQLRCCTSDEASQCAHVSRDIEENHNTFLICLHIV